MLTGRPALVELDQLQRKAHAARRALKAVQSEARAALQLTAQLDDELAALRHRLNRQTQPEEAQHARQDQAEAVRA